MSKSDLGEFSYFSTIIALSMIVLTLGMDTALMRFFKDNPIKSVFSNSLNFILIFSGSLLFIIFIFSDFFGNLLSDNPLSSILLSLSISIVFIEIINTISITYLRMVRKTKRFAATKVLMVLIGVILNYVFVKEFNMGPVGALSANLIATFIALLLYIDIIFKNYQFKIDPTLIKEMVKYAIPTIPSVLAVVYLQFGDQLIIKNLLSNEQLAEYSTNYKLALPMMMFVVMFEQAWKPFYMTNYQDQDANQIFKKVFTYFVLFSSLIFLFSAFFIEYIAVMPMFGGNFINDTYWAGFGIIPLILGGYFFFGLYNQFAVGFHIKKITHHLPQATISGAVLNILLNLFLIPKFGYWGAAYATISSYFLIALILYIKSKKYFKIDYQWKKVLTLIALTLIAYSTIELLDFERGLFDILIKSISIIILILLLLLNKFFTKNELNFLKKIIRK